MPIYTIKSADKPLQAKWEKHVLEFKNPAGTSRGVMHSKDCYLLYVNFIDKKNIVGIGECCPIWGLSIDDKKTFESVLQNLCDDIDNYKNYLNKSLLKFPSINFALEMALKSLEQNGSKILFPSDFTQNKSSIKINGLIWMGSIDFMQNQIEEKIKLGFTCIKLKIGSMDFERELSLISSIRNKYSETELEIRVDANGAFDFENALEKLKALAGLHIHSIEQPIKAGNWEQMRQLCSKTPLPIALDEELIGVFKNKEPLLTSIKPQFLILKPSLLGGFTQAEEWMAFAKKQGIGWWITSALESNIGLNAIAQFTYQTSNKLPQGLGTGSIYKNNLGEGNKLVGEQFYFG